jgi:hypothetical protein
MELSQLHREISVMGNSLIENPPTDGEALNALVISLIEKKVRLARLLAIAGLGMEAQDTADEASKLREIFFNNCPMSGQINDSCLDVSPAPRTEASTITRREIIFEGHHLKLISYRT